MTRMLPRLAEWTRRKMPTRDEMAQSRFIPNSVLRSELWRFTRRSVPRGVALGMLVGILLPFAQIFFAALFSIPARANVPLAAATTFVTNPFTTPFIWAFSYKVGAALMRADSMILTGPIDSLFRVTDFWSFLQWLTAEGEILALGLLVVAVISAAVCYLAASFGWGIWIMRKHKARRQRGRPGPI